jgi:hypothetical protein
MISVGVTMDACVSVTATLFTLKVRIERLTKASSC